MESYDLWKLTPPEVASHPCKVCQFDVYNDSELCEDCQKEEENEMITTKSPVELIKEELCSRYGLDVSQVEVNITLWGIESTEKADQIRNEYDTQPEKVATFLNSYKGRNLIDEKDPNNSNYVTGLDYGTYSRSENLANLSIYTKNGVIKNES